MKSIFNLFFLKEPTLGATLFSFSILGMVTRVFIQSDLQAQVTPLAANAAQSIPAQIVRASEIEEGYWSILSRIS